ncbi:LPXTG-motif cell wall-anchored protein/TQXA domain-containing protein [Lentzea atacamensis]|uniref:LPXTG-motif cell wall-anchored protein/TQXA domain-containing protein n=1 Tax=Lentzea atacamensis TaxID=531938 RepID=A0A316ID63_9PSEU|nr:thioester domain-containing protein [Lentzea atacamensis]PWK90899.1 LPXTG-motif cell wall-anchored protein/TQXA domain-containing protein [Lentzea atacamensis]RAS60425.1 LPXTG-motif cell wall-anchored protein/TQXA domain-containing protein [Lentzea atacamensis]
MASRLRIGAALLGAVATLAFTALPASADNVIIIPDREGQPKGEKVALKKGVGRLPAHGENYLDTSLIQLRIKGQDETKVLTYCVELPTELKDGDHLKEVPWDKHPNEKFNEAAGKVLYVLTNSFPGISMKDVKDKWGEQFSQEETIAATQAAIWHFTDKSELDDKDERNSKDVKTLYAKLVEQAEKNPINEQPKPTLEIEPASKSGKSGEKIGPFKVTTTASEVKLTANLPEGVTITDEKGNPLAVKKKGDELAVQGTGEKVSEFFVNVPANAPAGSASFQLSAEAKLSIGRLFVALDKASTGEDEVAQSLVVAQPQKAKVEKEGKVDWKLEVKPSEPTTPTTTTTTTTETTTPTTTTTAAPAPGGGSDDLASTGASILWPLLGGLVLVGAGAGALFVVRRKKAGA